MFKCMIDGRSSDDYTDDELVALTQKIGAKVDTLRDQRRAIAALLAGRRVHAASLAQAKASGLPDVVAGAIANEAVRHYEENGGVSVVVPGVVIEANAGGG